MDMNVTLSPEALDLVQRGRRLLVEAGPEGHTGNQFCDPAGRRCTWGRLAEAFCPGEVGYMTALNIARYESPLGEEIDDAYEVVNGIGVDELNFRGYDAAVEALDK